MLDQCIIQVVAAVPVNPDVFTDKDFTVGNAQLSGSSLGYKNRTRFETSSPARSGRRAVADDGDWDDGADDDDDPERTLERAATGCIRIFEDNALVVYTRASPDADRNAAQSAEPGPQYVDSIVLNPSKFIHGHNGHTLATEAEICLALSCAKEALTAILQRPEDAGRLIPGLGQASGSYWSQMEIAMNILDEDKAIFKQMANMRNSAIRSKAVREENTVYQRGTRFILKAYDKVAHLKNKNKPRLTFDETLRGITRLELVAKSKGLALDDRKKPVPDGASFQEFGAKRWPVSFNLAYLINLHREMFSGLKAVYMKAPDPKEPASSKKGYAVVFAALCMQRDDLSVADVIEAYSAHGTGGDHAGESLRRNIEKAISESSTLDSKALLSDRNYRNQPGVAASGVAPYLSRFPGLAIDPEISQAYAFSKGVGSTQFMKDAQVCRAYTNRPRKSAQKKLSGPRP
jgi:hypothetical protein